MNKEEIENKIEEKLKRRCIGLAGSDWLDTYNLIQESNREAIEKFRSFCEGEVYEKRLSDEHYVLVSILIDAYLSSIGKEER